MGHLKRWPHDLALPLLALLPLCGAVGAQEAQPPPLPGAGTPSATGSTLPTAVDMPPAAGGAPPTPGASPPAAGGTPPTPAASPQVPVDTPPEQDVPYHWLDRT